MVYSVINLGLAIFLVWLSYYVDEKTNNVGNPLVFMSTLLAGCTGSMGLAVLGAGSAPGQFVFIMGQVSYFLLGFYLVQFCVYCITYPEIERKTPVKVISWVLVALCCWIVFTQFTAINITKFLGLRVDAKSIFTNRLTNYFPYSWSDGYSALFLYIFPGLSILIMLMRSEERISRLDHQKAILNAIAIIAFWCLYALIRRPDARIPLFSTFIMAMMVVTHVLLVKSALQNFLYDIYSIIGIFVTFFFAYFLPSVFIGFMFAIIWKYRELSPRRFSFLLLVVISIAATASYQVRKYLSRKSRFRTNQYESDFEQELSQLEYSDEPSEIVKNMKALFEKHIGMQFVRVLIDCGNEEIASIYDKEDEEPIVLDTRNILFDSLLNQNSRIVFKSSAEMGYRFFSMRRELGEFFKKTKSDAFILLTEGRHIIGMILLGEKAGGNIYSDYDERVFSKLYSYFFVFGYYLKNIGNQEIVGTVNREISMSGQIIDSIQRNIDPIKNKKFDIGNMMIHAHNIGGEFIDLIRLSDDKHIFVLGDLSGKGIAASMSMVITKSIIRSYLNETNDFKLLVEKVNEFVRFNLPKGTFFEGLFGLIDFADSTVYYINCGVPALFLYNRAYNNVMEIQGEGHVLGFVKDITPYIKVKKVKLNHGDILLTCTDGLIDAHSLRGEQFGKDRVQKALTENSMLTSEKISEIIYGNLVDFVSKELEDDISIFILKYLK
ncbi:MAG: serine/threonine-protein phosphatase [Treponema sp.]|nr:serine/threonine-protein phosphatase [Treponema sp.]